jgi:hypothetical protein
MIKSGKILLKNLAIIAVLVLTFTTTGNVTFASEVLTVPESTTLPSISTEASAADYIVDIQDVLVTPSNTDAFLPKVLVSEPDSKVGPLSVVGPVWTTRTWNVVKQSDGRTVAVTWDIATDSTIFSGSVSFNTGGIWTPAENFTGPNAKGVLFTKEWTYYTPGTYSVGGVAQLLTSSGYASCFVGPRVVVIF